jgi:hypothetical protein
LQLATTVKYFPWLMGSAGVAEASFLVSVVAESLPELQAITTPENTASTNVAFENGKDLIVLVLEL